MCTRKEDVGTCVSTWKQEVVGCLPPLFSTLLLRQGLSLNLKFTISAKLAGQQIPRSMCVHIPVLRYKQNTDVLNFHPGARDLELESSPPACRPSALIQRAVTHAPYPTLFCCMCLSWV